MSPRTSRPVNRRRRDQIRTPRYPRALVAVLLFGASCTPRGGAETSTTTPSSAVSVAVASDVSSTVPTSATSSGVSIATPPKSSASSVTTKAQQLADGAPTTFPEDTEEIHVGSGCRGKCPPPWVLRQMRRDRGQVQARLRYCLQAGTTPQQRPATLEASVHVDQKGHPSKVEVTSTDAPQQVIECARLLLKKTTFEPNKQRERQARGTETLNRTEGSVTDQEK